MARPRAKMALAAALMVGITGQLDQRAGSGRVSGVAVAVGPAGVAVGGTGVALGTGVGRRRGGLSGTAAVEVDGRGHRRARCLGRRRADGRRRPGVCRGAPRQHQGGSKYNDKQLKRICHQVELRRSCSKHLAQHPQRQPGVGQGKEHPAQGHVDEGQGGG